MIKASGNEVEGFWPNMFAKALKGQNIEELLSNVGSGAAVAVAAAGPVTEAPAAKKDEKGIFHSRILFSKEGRGQGRSCRRRYGWIVRRRILSQFHRLSQQTMCALIDKA